MAEKQEYPPLLPEGFHDFTMDDLGQFCVETFENPWVRRKLLASFRDLVSILRDIGIDCELWIDGSFLTKKPEPADIDVVLLSDDPSREKLTVSQANTLDKLIRKKDLTMHRYRCDLSYCGRDDASQREQWVKDYGLALRSKEPKGIARLRLVP